MSKPADIGRYFIKISATKAAAIIIFLIVVILLSIFAIRAGGASAY